jgi:hypothetical protein
MNDNTENQDQPEEPPLNPTEYDLAPLVDKHHN